MLLNKSLNLAVRLEREGKPPLRWCRFPSILPRLVELPCEQGRSFLPLESILIRHLEDLFELHRIQAAAAFRVTRNGDLAIDEEAEDLLIEIQESIKNGSRAVPSDWS